MERLQGPINPCFLGEHLDVELLEQGFVNQESWGLEEEEELHLSIPCFEDKMPFLQMLQSVESPSFFPLKEPNFQTLLRLQHVKKPWELNPLLPHDMETQIQTLEFESCVTHEIVDLPSPVKSETKDLQNPHSTCSYLEGISSVSNTNSAENYSREGNSPPPATDLQIKPTRDHTHFPKSTPPVTRERKKRKRTKTTKNKEEVESQRMTHIAVERNRRRQMNDHLNSLRSLMPPSYIQRGDQASIIGGAIDFVKELEQLLQYLETQKRMRKEEGSSTDHNSPNGLVVSRTQSGSEREEAKAENKSETADIEVTVIQNHVNMKIQCPRRHGQLLKAIVSLENLRLTVLHLNITTSQSCVHYSFNLKMEEECKLGSADEIASAVHQIFRYIIKGC